MNKEDDRKSKRDRKEIDGRDNGQAPDQVNELYWWDPTESELAADSFDPFAPTTGKTDPSGWDPSRSDRTTDFFSQVEYSTERITPPGPAGGAGLIREDRFDPIFDNIIRQREHRSTPGDEHGERGPLLLHDPTRYGTPNKGSAKHRFLFLGGLFGLLVIIGTIAMVFILYNTINRPRPDMDIKYSQTTPDPSPSNKEAPSQRWSDTSENNGYVLQPETSISDMTPSMRIWRYDAQVQLESLASSLLAQPEVAAAIHPKIVDIDRVQKETEKAVKELEATDHYVYSFEVRDISRKILSKYAIAIYYQQLQARLDEMDDVRNATGRASMTVEEIKIVRNKILEELIDRVALGLAGMDDYAPTEKELDKLASATKGFENSQAHESWIRLFFQTRENYRNWLRLEMAGNQYLTEKSRSHVKVSEDQMRKYYQMHQPYFETVDRVEVSQFFIRIPSEQESTHHENLIIKLENIAAKLNSGKGFDQIQQEVAKDDIQAWTGFVERGDLPSKLEKSVFTLDEGQISPVISTSRGLHIFKVMHRHSGKVSFENVKARIRGINEADKLKEFLNGQLPLLREALEIKKNSNWN